MLRQFVFAATTAVLSLAMAGVSWASQPAEGGARQGAQEGALADMTLGDPDAPVTVIEYASVTCNHCARWHIDVWPTIKERYVDTGKVRFVFREMPVIPNHPALIARSYAGSMLARCAAEKAGADGYFDVMDALFKQQESWAFGADARTELLAIAGGAGLDEAAFDACLRRADVKDHIDDHIQIAIDTYEVQGTPGFIVNGALTPIFGVDGFSKALDEAIAAAR